MQYNFLQIVISLILIPILLLIWWRLRLKRLKKYDSPLLGEIEIFKKFNGELALTTNKYIQGITINDKSIEQSYWFFVAQQTSNFCQKRKNPQVLMLGLGANTIPNLIAKFNPSINQTLVEFDSLIIKACKEFFGLDELPNSKLIQADAYKLFSKPINHKPYTIYHVIIVDIFTGQPPYHSIKSNQPSFIEKLLPHLKKDGMMIFNRPAHNEHVRADGQKLKEYLNTLFKSTEVFDIEDPRGFRNYVITANCLI